MRYRQIIMQIKHLTNVSHYTVCYCWLLVDPAASTKEMMMIQATSHCKNESTVELGSEIMCVCS